MAKREYRPIYQHQQTRHSNLILTHTKAMGNIRCFRIVNRSCCTYDTYRIVCNTCDKSHYKGLIWVKGGLDCSTEVWRISIVICETDNPTCDCDH